jgi:hypothetical protein
MEHDMNNSHEVEFDMDEHESDVCCFYEREGALTFVCPEHREMSPRPALFATQEGIYPVSCWANPPEDADPNQVHKVRATLLNLPNGELIVVEVK